MRHKPVLLEETLRLLKIRPGDTAVDGTLGSAGHSAEILKALGPQGRLLALDRDAAAIDRCRPLFEGDARVSLHVENFKNIDRVLDALNLSGADAVLLDVGFSSDQIEDPERGFSFDRPGPLDMRMDKSSPVTAAHLVNTLPEDELEALFRDYGGERKAGRIARVLSEQRRSHPLETTDDLVRIVNRALGGKYAEKTGRPGWARRHPATRVFQALRIAVNSELDSLREGLPRIWQRLNPGGRLAVMSFHSLEDRIVKYQFLDWHRSGQAAAFTKKPVVAAEEERLSNPRSRSAKLRAIEKR